MANRDFWYKKFYHVYDTTTGFLTPTEHGVLNLLLDQYYRSGAPLVGDIEALIRFCRCTQEFERRAVHNVVAQFFTLESDGCYHNRMCDGELNHRADIRAKRAAAGKAGAIARWTKHREAKMRDEEQERDSAQGKAAKQIHGLDSSKRPFEPPRNFPPTAWQKYVELLKEKKESTTYNSLLIRVRHIKKLSRVHQWSIAIILMTAVDKKWASLTHVKEFLLKNPPCRFDGVEQENRDPALAPVFAFTPQTYSSTNVVY
jgi:uncharacterized protein YdaU (DUF1376 family)